MTPKKIIAMVLAVVLLAVGALLLLNTERRDQARMRELYAQIEPLQRQRDTLAQERDNLEKDFALKMRDPATVQLLFRELDEQLFSDVYPLMRDRGITGVLGLSGDSFPGSTRRGISDDQYNRLLMDGWSGCYIYTSQSSVYNLSDWLDTIETRTVNHGIPKATAIYFANDNYQSEFDELLIAHGITTVITAAPDGRSATVTDVSGPLWFTGAMPWNYTGVTSDTDLLARTERANLTFTISFSNLWDAYEEASFIATLDNWESMQVIDDPLVESLNQPEAEPETDEDPLLKPQLRICSYETARQTHLDAAMNDAGYQAEFARRQAELDEQIAALDEQIRALYDQWQK